MTDWKERAERAEAELARLRKDVEFYRNFAAEVLAVKRLPMPHDMEALCRTAYENRYHKIKAEVGYDEWRLIWVRAIASHEVAPPAQPAEPVQRLSDERAAFEAWHNEYRTQELVRRDDTYYNTHVRCRWEGWQARAIESALQPGWLPIESAPKDGTEVALHEDGRVFRGFWFETPFKEYRDDFGNYIDQQDEEAYWMDIETGDSTEPTEWQARPLPPAPKATK